MSEIKNDSGTDEIDINELMSISITVTFNAVEKTGDGTVRPFNMESSRCFSVSGDKDFILDELRTLGRVIKEGILYGWLCQQHMECEIFDGRIQPKTIDEQMADVREWCKAESKRNGAAMPVGIEMVASDNHG